MSRTNTGTGLPKGVKTTANGGAVVPAAFLEKLRTDKHFAAETSVLSAADVNRIKVRLPLS
jgi:hypothetical protein